MIPLQGRIKRLVADNRITVLIFGDHRRFFSCRAICYTHVLDKAFFVPNNNPDDITEVDLTSFSSVEVIDNTIVIT